MKKILITAKNSYIGNAFASWTKDQYDIEFVSCRTNDWEKKDFSKFDTILHVAGIAHVSTDSKMESEYFRVNRDLTVKLANKAKAEGVKQFVFMSSIIIYGDIDSMENNGLINKETPYKPKNFYGLSKLEADIALQRLQDINFNITIIRTPVVYGPDSKGNFSKLVNIAKKAVLFPKVENYRSMIFIDNLSEFIRHSIERNYTGVFYPQNREYINTSQMISDLSNIMGKKVYLVRTFNPIIKILSKKYFLFNKVLGNKIYDKKLSGEFDYCVVDYAESLKKSI